MKLCECGCGEPAPIAKRTVTRWGHQKGKPVRFIRGHHNRRRKQIPLSQRFWDKVDMTSGPSGCWLWQAACLPTGYGVIGAGGGGASNRRAHRVAYELTYGPIPSEDLEGNRILVCHTCDHPRCVNPGHLRLGTQAENLAEMDARDRRVRPQFKGDANPNAKLTAADVRVIREWCPAGWKHRDLAEAFGVSRDTIGSILREETWTHAKT